MNSASEANRGLHGNTWELREQYNQEHSDLWYEHNGLQARIATFYILIKVSYNYFRVAHERLEAYKSAPASSSLRLEMDLSSYLGDCLMLVKSFVNETIDVHLTRIFEMTLSASLALEQEPCNIIKVLRSPERCVTVFGANPGEPTRSPGPSSPVPST